MSSFRKIIVSGFGSGYLPRMPGTWSSGVVCAIFLAVVFASPTSATAVMLAILLLASIACVVLGPFAESTFGRKDPGQCTLDEWAGQALTLLLLPIGSDWYQYLVVAAAAFFTFRFFDITKPWPARWFEKLPHGWGVLLDDIVAAIYANLLCQLLLRVVLNW